MKPRPPISESSNRPDAGEQEVAAAEPGREPGEVDRLAAELVDVEAGDVGGVRVLADRPHLEPPAGAVEEPPDERHERVDEVEHPRLVEQRRADERDVGEQRDRRRGSTTSDCGSSSLGEEADEAEHEHVEHQADDELVGRQAVAHVRLHRRDEQAGDRRHQRAPTHVEPVRSTPTAAANAPASIIPSSEMLIVPAFSATSSPERREQQHDGGDRRVAVRALVGGDVAERGRGSRPRQTLDARGGQRPAALADVEDRRRQQQRRARAGPARRRRCGRTRRWRAGSPTRCAGRRTRRRRRSATSTRWRATSATSSPANPIPAPKLATSW